MTESPRESIYDAISSIRLIDPHTHINPHRPASTTLADILGYHYYTELVHSSGMPRAEIEQAGLHPRELVERLVQGLPNIENTANYQWLISICRMFFGFDDVRIDQSNWESLYDAAEARMNSAEWPQIVLDQSNVEAVFLTNDFDDDLQGFDTNTYIPCLRTDDLVFHLAKPEIRERLEVCTEVELTGTLQSLRDSLQQRFEHFVACGARACAISLPPSFEPAPVSDGRALTALDEVLRRGPAADESHRAALSRRVFWTLAELCDHYGLPFDLMIGVNRGVYPGGVYQGQDLYDSRVSLIQYRQLFNTFSDVKFPVSVLASVTNQELVSYAWIFPNVITNGHWWYSNTPSFIARDAAARLEAVPRNQQVGYYSDAYKLEFVWPKFDMYRQILAGILADHFVGFCGWSEERAIDLGRQVLRDNVDTTFAAPEDPEATTPIDDTYVNDTVQIETVSLEIADEDDSDISAAATAGLAAGAIGMVEVDDAADVDFVDDPGETLEIVASNIEADAPGSELSPDDQFDTIDEDMLPELPTVVDGSHETVNIDEELDAELMDFKLDHQANAIGLDETIDIDPLPTDDEIQDTELPDVELVETDQERAPDAADIDAQADSSPLDVGDVLDDQDDVSVLDDDLPEDSEMDQIRMLRGETTFTPDEDSMQLTRDPVTGEYTFPIPGADNDPTPAGETDELNPLAADDQPVADDDLVLDETIDWQTPPEPVAELYSFDAEEVLDAEEGNDEVAEFDQDPENDDQGPLLDETIDFNDDENRLG